LCYYFGHLKTVYFAVPGEIEDLTLKPATHSIFVTWKNASSNSDSITNYTIECVNTVIEHRQTTSVAREEGWFFIENLDACVEYEVSVTAVNADDEGNKTVNCKVTTVTVGNCHTHIILLCL
jgi:hypothetical protein